MPWHERSSINCDILESGREITCRRKPVYSAAQSSLHASFVCEVQASAPKFELRIEFADPRSALLVHEIQVYNEQADSIQMIMTAEDDPGSKEVAAMKSSGVLRPKAPVRIPLESSSIILEYLSNSSCLARLFIQISSRAQGFGTSKKVVASFFFDIRINGLNVDTLEEARLAEKAAKSLTNRFKGLLNSSGAKNSRKPQPQPPPPPSQRTSVIDPNDDVPKMTDSEKGAEIVRLRALIHEMLTATSESQQQISESSFSRDISKAGL